MTIEYGKWYDCREGNMPEDMLGTKLEIDGYCCTEEVILHAPSSLRHRWQDGIVGYLRSDYISQHRCKAKGQTKWHWEYPSVKPLRWLAIPPSDGNYDWLSDAKDLEEICKRIML